MAHALPQLSGRLFVTDGGLETTPIFLDEFALPEFAAFTVWGPREGEAALRQ
ncbi:MAG TPA: hypothetical protein VG496_13610 [Myxococcales bacterium]|nr:hypothetical protein [Myxococcales bacterium]